MAFQTFLGNLRISPWLMLALLLLAGCQPTVYLMPTPVAIQGGRIDPFVHNPNLERSNRIRIFYATNRQPAEGEAGYGNVPDERLHLGEAELKIGDRQTLWEQLYAASTRKKRDRRWPLRLVDVRESAAYPADLPPETLSPALRRFFRQLNAAIEASQHRELTIYIHGANNNFYRGAAQAAQFQHFTGHNAVLMLFAWPSAASLLRYGTDVEQAAVSAPVLSQLLRLLARHTKARHINIIAYSAGAMVSSPALRMLREAESGLSDKALYRKLRLGEIYYAAPDVDFRGFLHDLARYQEIGCNVTLTVNLNDYVLGMARGFHGSSRAGAPDVEELNEEETRWLLDASSRTSFDILDVGDSPIPGLGSAHDFWYHNPWVSTDVLIQLLYHARPALRGLEEQPLEGGGQVWHFPPDYPARAVAAVEHLEQIGHYDCDQR